MKEQESKELKDFLAAAIKKATAEWGGQEGYNEWYRLVKGREP